MGLGQFPALGTGLCVTSVLALSCPRGPLDRVLACTRVTPERPPPCLALCVMAPDLAQHVPACGGHWLVACFLLPEPVSHSCAPYLPVPVVPCPVPASPWLSPAPSGRLVLTQPHTPGPRSLESLAGSLCEITVRGQDQRYSATTPGFCYPGGHI